MHAPALFATIFGRRSSLFYKIDFPDEVSPERLARAFILKKQQTLPTPTTPLAKGLANFSQQLMRG